MNLLEITSCMPEIDYLDGILQNSEYFAVIQRNGRKNIIVSTNLKLCKTRECQKNCKDLHLSSNDLLQGNQRRSSVTCEYCNNQKIIFDRTILLTIDLQVCVSYNKGSGEYGNYPDKEACNRLHVCENYIRGICEDTECSRSHDFYEPHPMKTLQGKGVPSQLMGSLYLVYRNILALRHRNTARDETVKDNTKSRNKGKVPESLKSYAGNNRIFMMCSFHVLFYSSIVRHV
uniref:C3H1-type domain-containing protein n=1 Tax=Electrophorus electricus TaxID=8005 RepID=A0A4W4FQ67_ELEEL